MTLRIIGEPLLARDAGGKLKSRIATVFLGAQTIVTLRGVHATQRLAYLDGINQQRAAAGRPPLTSREQAAELADSVDLVMEGDTVLIRPDPAHMGLAFQADELLQEIVRKEQIKFLHVLDPQVRNAVKRRGESWRINPLPRSPADMQRMIAESRIGVGGREIYYYNRETGTRFLTCQEFGALGALEEAERRRLLEEIRKCSAERNRLGRPEIAFFAAGQVFSAADFAPHDFATMPSAQLQAVFTGLRERFENAVPADLRRDDVAQVEWRNRMYGALIGHEEDAVSEEALLGLGAEFYMQVEWLPGGRIEEGELIFDSAMDDGIEEAAAPRRDRLILHETVRGFIINLIREYGDLEYVNIGQIIGSLSLRAQGGGRRGVFVAEVKQRGADQPFLRIIRMQKWGVTEHLDEGRSLLEAITRSEEYTDYTLNRRLGCRQLGMNLPPRTTAHKISERYFGRCREYRGMAIFTPYFERDYIRGIATDKIPPSKFANDSYAYAFARLLGRAAAPNLIVGRCLQNGRVIFDDGDEVVIENKVGMAVEIILADQTGTFTDFRRSLTETAPAYAAPINKRRTWVGSPAAFAQAYLEAFEERFTYLQWEYRRRKRAFDNLFKHQPPVEGGNLSYRWLRVLERLNQSDPKALTDLIRKHIEVK